MVLQKSCTRHLSAVLPMLHWLHLAATLGKTTPRQISGFQANLAGAAVLSFRMSSLRKHSTSTPAVICRQFWESGWPQHQQTGSAPATGVGP